MLLIEREHDGSLSSCSIIVVVGADVVDLTWLRIPASADLHFGLDVLIEATD